MDKQYIASRASHLQTREDLLNLLSEMKKDELGNAGYPFKMKQLTWYCNPNHVRRRYKHFSILKKSGKKRNIDAPARGLMSLLTYINKMLQAMYTPNDHAVGFIPGRSIVTGAKKHVNHRFVLNLDLKDFFTSIEKHRVFGRLRLAPFNFNIEIANTVAGLCCMRIGDKEENYKYVLPQGSPASPTITNLVCEILDRRLAGLAKRFELTYTRYADDITFSGNRYVFSKNGAFYKELYRIIEDQQLEVNTDKTRLQKRGGRQEVTGVVVSDRVNVTREYVKEIRDILYMWEKYGHDDAFARFYPKYKKEKGHVKKGEPTLEGVIGGKLLYMKMVKGEDSPTYQKLQKQFDRLTATDNESNSIELTMTDIPFAMESVSSSDIDKKLDDLISSGFDLSIL